MRRVLPLALLLLAAPALASPGVNLRWDRCYGDAGVANRSFACDTNTGFDTLVGSFVLAFDFPQATELQAPVDVVIGSGTTVPDWWQFRNPGTCRLASLTANGTIPPGSVVCQDWMGGSALTAFTYTTVFENRARILVDLGTTQPVDLVAGVEYFGFNLRIDHAKTVGAGSCAGCPSGACLGLRSVRVLDQQQHGDTVSGSTTPAEDSFFALWQGAVGVSSRLGAGCPRAVPVRRETWSRVKQLYR